nr:PucR family transcriptional regulator [Mycobacterium sp. QGD 101]
MIPSVADVVGMPVVQRGNPQVISAANLDRPVRWVHVGDLPDLSKVLQGGELVLTTGAALHSDPERFLRGLLEAGAAGVVVELGTHMTEVPSAVGQLATSLELPLIALHREIKFVEVTEAVHRMIVADQYEEVAFARRVHEKFTELSMMRASLADIVAAAAQILDEPVVLEDLAHQVLAVSAAGGSTAVVLRDWERRSRLTHDDWLVADVGPRGEQWGRLIVPQPPAHVQRSKMVLERASQALAMNRMAEQGRSGLEHQAHSGLVDDIMRGRITDERDAAVRAHALGLRPAATYHPAVVAVSAARPRLDPVAAQRRNVAILDAVVHAVKSLGHSGLFSARQDGEVGVVLALNARRGTLDELGEAIGHEVRRGVAARRVVVGVGSSAQLITDAVRGLGEAAHVAEVAMSMPDDQRAYYRAADVRLRGLLALLRDDPRVQNFAETELKALLAEDLRSGQNNLEVLRAYLQKPGNKSAVAQRLHISRPALYQRLADIQKLLGVDLDDGESLTSLHAALLVLDAKTSV